jgi:hypothetical protein
MFRRSDIDSFVHLSYKVRDVSKAKGERLDMKKLRKSRGGRMSVSPEVEREREHLESLYQERINFFVVFASVVVVGFGEIHDRPILIGALWAMTLVSTAITLSIIRTFRLVMKALAEIKADHTHPYTRYWHAVSFPWDANKSLVCVPVILTIFFWGATFYYSLGHGHKISPEAQASGSDSKSIYVPDPGVR